MEIIRGKQTSFMGASTLNARLATHNTVHIDIGTGDGRFVQTTARTFADRFIIGVDACRENLTKASRRTAANALFVIANAETMPSELRALACHVTVNFPWGSLLEGLLTEDSAIVNALLEVTRPGASVEFRLNAGATQEAGWPLDAGAERVRDVLAQAGFEAATPTSLTTRDLKAFPTTWAKRLAFGRDPRAICLAGVKQMTSQVVQHPVIPAGV